MSDLISRKAALEHLYGRLIESANNNVGVWEDAGIVFEEIATERLKRWINEIPTIDPVKHVFSTAFDPETDMLVAERNGKKIEFVKVVRCQDCEMWGNSIILKDQSKGDCPNLGLMIDGDFFCKWGARMDEVTA